MPEDNYKLLSYAIIMAGLALVGIDAFAANDIVAGGLLGAGGEAVGGLGIAYLVYENKKRLDGLVHKVDEIKERLIKVESRGE